MTPKPSNAKISRVRARWHTAKRQKNKVLAAARLELLKTLKKERKEKFEPRRYEVGEDAVDLIKSFEGCYLKAYRDVVGVWTIGYGHTENVSPNDKLTDEAAAARLLKNDLERKYAPAVRALPQKITQGQGDALLSLVYNLGTGIVGKDYTLGKLVRRGSYRSAALSMMLYVKAGGKTWAGLVRRRRAEQKLFRS